MKKHDAPGLFTRAGRAIASVLPRHPDAARRYDGLENSFMGYGTARDKTTFGAFTMTSKLSDSELYALYYTDDVSAKIVNKKPAEMLRRGYKLTSKKNPQGAEKLQKLGEGPTLAVKEKILRGFQWGRLWGGAIAVKGCNDSEDLSLPVARERVTDMKFLNVVDKRFANVLSWQDNPSLPRFGEAEFYTFSSMSGGAGPGPAVLPSMKVHASRVVRFVGVEETDQITVRRLGGWTFSTLQRPYDVVRSFATTFKSIEHLISDASQGVWKIQNLIELLGSNREELLTRLAFSDMTRSAGRAIMLDADNESFERVATSFAGIKDVVDATIQRLAAASDLPVTLLVGRSPAGMNATGDADFRAWYDILATEQNDTLKPIILDIYGDLCGGQIDDLDVEFPALWTPTAQEKAATDLSVAQADQIYFNMGAVLAEQVAIARFGSGNGKIEIDEDAVNASLDQEIELMLRTPEEKAKDAEAAAALNPKAPADPTDTDAKKDPNADPAKPVPPGQ